MNKRKTLVVSALVSVLSLSAGAALAADQIRDQSRDLTKVQSRMQDQIYGSQLMTVQQRNEYRVKMRAARTLEAQQNIREEHHQRMKQIANERGMTLPDRPPARGGKMGGMGSRGDGMGSGSGGMGAGGGSKR